MSQVFKVDEERFVSEYKKSVKDEPNNEVNWFTDGKELHAYIVTAASTFYYRSPIDKIPELFKIEKMISKSGMILGVVEPMNKIGENSPDSVDKITKLMNIQKA